MENNVKELRSKDLEKLPHELQVTFAIFCAKQVIHLVKDEDKKVCVKAIETAEAYLEGKASKEDCKAAANAAANAAAYAANHAAANAANAAAYTANYADYAAYNTAYNAAANAAHAAYAAASKKEEIIKAQWDYYNDLLIFVDGTIDNLIINGE